MKKIMIVEDEKVICEELCALLKNAGYEAEILTDFAAFCVRYFGQ